MEYNTRNFRKNLWGELWKRRKAEATGKGKGRASEIQPQKGKIHALKSFSVKHSPSVSSFILLFLSVLLYKGSTKPMHSPVKCIFFFFCGQEILAPAQKSFSSANRQNTSCLSDEWVYPRGSCLANRHMAKEVKLAGGLFVTREARSQLTSPGADGFRSHSPSLWKCCQDATGSQLAGRGQSRTAFASWSPQPSEREALS